LDVDSKKAYDALVLQNAAPPIFESHLPSLARVLAEVEADLALLAHQFARRGQTERDVVRSLVRRGCDQSAATEIAAEAVGSHRRLLRQRSVSLITAGVTIAAVGILLNVKLFEFLIEKSASAILIVYGPILFGLGLTAKGVFQLFSNQLEE
jgi:hypothetical protein